MCELENVRIVIEDGVLVESQGTPRAIVENLAAVLGFLVGEKRKPGCTVEDTVKVIQYDILQMARLFDATKGLQCEVMDDEA